MLAFGAWVRSHVYVLPDCNKKEFRFHHSCSPPIIYIVNCLHSALFVCTALIISVLRSVDNLAFCLHAVYTCLHSSARPSLHLSAPNCTMVVPPAQFGIGGAIFWLERPKKLPPFIVLTAFSRALRQAAVAEVQRKNWCADGVQTSADSADKKLSCLHFVIHW